MLQSCFCFFHAQSWLKYGLQIVLLVQNMNAFDCKCQNKYLRIGRWQCYWFLLSKFECINTLKKTYFTFLPLKCGHVPESLKGSMFGPNRAKDGDEDGLYAKRESLDIPGHKWWSHGLHQGELRMAVCTGRRNHCVRNRPAPATVPMWMQVLQLRNILWN